MYLRHINEVVRITEEITDIMQLKAEVDESYSMHSQDYLDVTNFLNSSAKIVVNENGRDDIQIQVSLLEQYMDFWKSRFDYGQDYLFSYETDKDDNGDLNEAGQRLHSVPLQFVKDWMKLPYAMWKELFGPSELSAVYLRFYQVYLTFFTLSVCIYFYIMLYILERM